MDKQELKAITLPCGKCCNSSCEDCNYMDLYFKNNYGEA